MDFPKGFPVRGRKALGLGFKGGFMGKVLASATSASPVSPGCPRFLNQLPTLCGTPSVSEHADG